MSDETKVETVTTTETNTEVPVISKPTDATRAARLQELEDAWRSSAVKDEPVKQAATTEEKTVEETKPAVTNEVKTETQDPLKQDQADEFTKRFAQLSKKERQLQEREAKLKERDAELEELRQLREWKASAKKDPLRFAKDAELSLKDLADQTISGEKYSEKVQSQELAERLRRLEEATEKAKQEEAQRTQEAQGRAYAERIMANIDATPEKFQLVREVPGGKQLVISTIAEYYKQSGEEMSWEQAAQLTEDYLLSEKTKELNALLKLEKVRSKLNLPKAEPTKQETTKPANTGVKTLSNTNVSAPAVREVGKTTREERERRIKELTSGLFTE